MRRAFLLASLAVLFLVTARAQDPVKVDSNHYKVEFQNERVRGLRLFSVAAVYLSRGAVDDRRKDGAPIKGPIRENRGGTSAGCPC